MDTDQQSQTGRTLLVEGFARVDESKADVLEGEEWINRAAWRRYFRRAWRVRMQGGMFAEWWSAPLPDVIAQEDQVVFIWAMGTGSSEGPPQPTGRFDIELNGSQIISFHDSLTSRCWENGDIRFYYEVKRREPECSYGLGYLLVPSRLVDASKAARIAVRSEDTDSNRWFMLCEYGEANLAEGVSFSEPNARPVFIEDGLAAVLQGPKRPSSSDYQLYWGDLHVHSSMANYIQATPEQDYEYARFVSQLDFISITDQEHFLNDTTFDEVIRTANEHYAPGKFAPFIGFEWSSRRFGHRNVIFRGDEGVLVPRHDAERPYEPPYPPERQDSFQLLTSRLRQSGLECMLLPHHPSMTSMGPINWDVFDPDLETAVEIYSLWGSSECKGAPGRSLINDQRTGSYVHDALARGYRLGMLGSGETGDGHPGNTQWRRGYAVKNGLALTPLGGGLTAVWATELTREAIFDAIKARRCYGTTNARIVLQFHCNGHWMGEEIAVSDEQLAKGFPVSLSVKVSAVDRIKRISLIRNGSIIDCAHGFHEEMNWQHTDVLDRQSCLEYDGEIFTYYYVRVEQEDGHLAWSSPIWIRLKQEE